MTPRAEQEIFRIELAFDISRRERRRRRLTWDEYIGLLESELRWSFEAIS